MAKHLLINKKNIRRFILDYAERNRAHTYTRVGNDAYERIEASLRDACRRLVHEQPSACKTIK
jgi:hypothetical protein